MSEHDLTASIPIACSLEAADMRARFEQISALGRRALRQHILAGRSLTLLYASEVADELGALIEKERQCCAFLEFALQAVSGGVQLTITAPAESHPFSEELFAQFLGADAPAASSPSACGCRSSCGP